MNTQVILGAGGVIGNSLATELQLMNIQVRLMSRSHVGIQTDNDWFQGDLLNEKDVLKAVKGTEVAYLVAGLPYDTKIWQRDWPRVMNNVLKACESTGTKLVFFDNVYMYGFVDGWMTEDTPYNPCSRKGEVRAKVAETFMEHVKSNQIQGLIARSADFFGPGAAMTANYPMVFEMLAKGKAAKWLGDDTKRHSFTFTPDASKATALLGNSDKAYGEVWHLPSHHQALTGEEFIRKTANAFGAKASWSVLKPWMIKMAGWFNKMAAESMELLYQQTEDYLFDSSKFTARFFEPVTYEKGIQRTADYVKSQM